MSIAVITATVVGALAGFYLARRRHGK